MIDQRPDGWLVLKQHFVSPQMLYLPDQLSTSRF